jgi:enoyl-CoA hydratase/carnithine racemase
LSNARTGNKLFTIYYFYYLLSVPKYRGSGTLLEPQQTHADPEHCGQDASVRAIVLRAETGGGKNRVFSAGHNLKEMTADTGPEHHRRIFDTCESLMELIGRLPVPVIAAVDGLAAAAGCQLVASTDIAVATPGSRFSTPGASVGLFCHTPGIPLARRVPRAISGYMLLTGEPISGEEALRAGLISKGWIKKARIYLSTGGIYS